MTMPWRVVWITGASSGIGAAMAVQLAELGCAVAVSARSADALDRLSSGHPGIKSYPLDVTDAAKVAATAEAIARELGPIDLVVAGAGTYSPAAAADLDLDDFRRMLEVNYMGTLHVLAAVLPAMRQRKAGHVSWIASVAGYRGLPKAAAYGPTKAALISLAESLKPELESDGVTVSVINPGFVETPMTAQNDFPMPFLMKPEDAARRSIAGLRKGKFEVAYPTRFVLILKLLRILPYWLFFIVSRRMVG